MRRSWSAFRTLVVSGLAITALGCGGGGDGGSPTPPPALQINGGDAQQGTAGSALATSPSVKVVDRDGAGVAGVSVTFAVTGGGGSITGATATTNTSGVATVGSWTLGTTAGANTLSATASGITGSPKTFTATGNAGPAEVLAFVVQPGTIASGGVSSTVEVEVRDRNGNRVTTSTQAITLTLAANPGSGTLGGTLTVSAVNGRATFTGLTLDKAAAGYTLTATSTGLTAATSAAFTVVAGAPAAITMVQGNGQSANAGSAVAIALAVRVTDAAGNLAAGVTVTFAVVSGGGSVTGASAITNASGVATVGSWTLGTVAGANSLTATVAGLAPLTFTATGLVGPPASVTRDAGDNQTATVNTAVAIPPRVVVRDAAGNPVSGVTVTFAVTAGGGSITGGTVVTDANGRASVGSWTLGTAAGPNTLTATASGVGTPVSFAATAIAGAATSLTKIAGDGQSASVNSPVATRPAVLARDAFNNPVAGVVVTFTVTSGGGSVTGATQTTDANGIATVGSWTLGASTGTNTLDASASGLPTVTFTATATPSFAASVTGLFGVSQSGTPGTPVSSRPAVIVRDGANNPLGGVTVTFAVTGGGGSITGAVQTTDASGIATVGSWTLGGAGTNTLTATVSALPPVVFTAIAVAGSNFSIEIRFLGTTPTAGQLAAYNSAVARWAGIVTGELSDVFVDSISAGDCGPSSPKIINRTFDDLVIFAEFTAIDGPGGVLGSAGPCYIRDSNALSFLGIMRFDTADLANLEASGALNSVILHEMGHVLGVGSLWNVSFVSRMLLVGATTDTSHFTGPAALSAFNAAGGSSVTFLGSPVPVENCKTGVPANCGSGTRDSHWRESVFRNELMTGYLGSGTNPLSNITISSLQDLGYVVNMGVADPYSITPLLVQAGPAQPLMPLNEAPLTSPLYTMDAFGRTRQVPRP